MTNAELARRIERHGIVIPRVTVAEAHRTGLEVAVGCAFLMRETGGGHNIFGHDPTIYVGAGLVTKPKYLGYKARRGHTLMQGVGGMQLTWYSFQDQADRLGGCWNPTYNTRVGFGIVQSHIRASGLWKGAHDYNGSGPAAVAYANAIVSATHTWRAIIAGKSGDASLERAETAAQLEIAAAHDQHVDLLHYMTVGTPQSYLQKRYTWAARSIQIATRFYAKTETFMHAHPYLRVYDGLGKAGHVENSDHRCGYAVDLVPLTNDAKGKAALVAAQKDAKKNGAVYTELEWTAANKHLHISWARCPR